MRPNVPLVEKVALALGQTPDELLRMLQGWPSDDGSLCWYGPAKVYHAGRPRQTLRLCYELATGQSLPDGVRLRGKICPNAGCLNLHHYRPRAHVPWREKVGLVSRDLAEAAAHLPPPPELLNPDDEADILDLMDLITGGDGGRHRSAEDLHAQWTEYDLRLIQIALDRLHADMA